MFNIKIFLAGAACCIFFVMTTHADTIYLKNGKSVEGIIKRKDKKGNVEFNVGGGTVIFDAREIESIEKSSVAESQELKNNWRAEKLEAENRRTKYLDQNKNSAEKWEAMVTEQIRLGGEKRDLEASAKLVPLTAYGGHMLVGVVLNGNVPAALVIDTGCPSVLLAASIAKKMGVDLAKVQGVHEIMVLNGKHKVGTVILKSLQLGDVEEKDIQAEVLLQDNAEMRQGFKDGLLGMSFLNRFNMTVDQQKMKLILKSHK